MASIGFITMPAAHGKSHIAGRKHGMVEADQVINCKATPQLRRLRKEAKQSGDWEPFDKLWSSMITERLTPGHKWVVLVPSSKVGQAAGWEKLGIYLLEIHQWRMNLALRMDPVSKWAAGWLEEVANGGLIYEGNDRLQHDVIECASWYLD